MSDTPRTDAQAAHCEKLCAEMGWVAACRAVLHMAYWSEIMEARARRNGHIAWGMRRELAAMRDSIEAQRKVFREDSESLEDRLNKAVCDLAEERRQVEVLAAACSSHALIGANMAGTASEWRDWAAQTAKEGGGRNE